MRPATAKRPIEQFQTQVTLPEWQLEPDEESYFGAPDNGVAFEGPEPSPGTEQPAPTDGTDQPADDGLPTRLDDVIDRAMGRDGSRDAPRDYPRGDPRDYPRGDRRDRDLLPGRQPVAPPPPRDTLPVEDRPEF